MSKASTEHYQAEVTFVYEKDVFCGLYLKSHPGHARWDMRSSVLFNAAVALPSVGDQVLNEYAVRSRYPRRGLVVFILKKNGDLQALQYAREELAFCDGALIETLVLFHTEEEDNSYWNHAGAYKCIHNLADLHSAVVDRLNYSNTLIGFVNIKFQYTTSCALCSCVIPAQTLGVRHPYKGNLHMRCFNELRQESLPQNLRQRVVSEELLEVLHEENKQLQAIIDRHKIRRL